MRIIYLGEQFSYHHLAAIAYWGKENDFISTPDFGFIIEKVISGEVDHGIIAVENSLAGDVPGNFELLCNSPVEICGEITLKIELQLAANPNVSLQQIQTVYSHIMAIRETSNFFSAYPHIKFVETPSTSSAVKLISEQKFNNAAAIGSKTAINFYRLETISSDITNSSENMTRFLLLKNKSTSQLTTNFPAKASLMLQSDKSDKAIQKKAGLLKTREISFQRNFEGGKTYAEINFTNNFQFDNFLFEMQANALTVRVLGVYVPGLTMEGF